MGSRVKRLALSQLGPVVQTALVIVAWVAIAGVTMLYCAGCASAPAKTTVQGSTVEAKRTEVGPSRRIIRILPSGIPTERAEDAAPFWSPENPNHSGEHPADGLWDVAGAAVQRGGAVVIEEEYAGSLDASGNSNAGRIDTSSDEVAANGQMVGAPVDIAPLGSKKLSGSAKGGSSKFDVTAALADDLSLLYILGALMLAGAGVSFWLTRSLWLAGGLALAGGGVLTFAVAPGLGALVMLAAIAGGVLLILPAARAWAIQKQGLTTLVKGVEKVSDKENPQSAGQILKAALDRQLSAKELATIDKAIDPIKGA
jgi:hypothetical protein